MSLAIQNMRPRRTFAAVASSGLVLAAATSAAAAPSGEHAALPDVDVSTATAEALTALATTPTVSAPTGAQWSADSVADEVQARAPRPVVVETPEPVVERSTPAVERSTQVVERGTAVVERSTQRASRTEARAALPAQTAATAAGSGGATAATEVSAAGAPAVAPAAAPAPAPAPAASASASAIVNIARQYIGTPYVLGGSSPGGFDCSGFTQYVFAQVGISLPRTSSAQRGAGVVVSAAEARPGDLIWAPGHVGIYTGNGQHIAARNPSTPLYESPIYMSNPTFIRVTG
ncbi:NlpC/P60 family protein [Georgenia sp. TF02-10]|uniref:C40 family peptidase n=1 Tax=Georgenia sp. TF02-10 TaxID=2917725 RepID=UPI001FA6C4C9|nr:C40 family peptidase [Georgenia sp. TF02-10]UNX55214.1 NlpC/P60 family protein [Georgenia sp. TF02-10]